MNTLDNIIGQFFSGEVEVFSEPNDTVWPSVAVIRILFPFCSHFLGLLGTIGDSRGHTRLEIVGVLSKFSIRMHRIPQGVLDAPFLADGHLDQWNLSKSMAVTFFKKPSLKRTPMSSPVLVRNTF